MKTTSTSNFITKSHLYAIAASFGFAIVLKLIRNYFNGPIYKGKKDVSKKLIIVTGANSGIGKETALDLLANGATVIFACRNEKATNEVIDSIKDKDQRDRAIFIKLDLCNIDSVYDFCIQVKSKYKMIDIIVNNAGLMADSFSLTKDGVESSLQGNHLGHMAMTHWLLEIMNKEEGRIINLSSIGHRRSNYSVNELKRLESNLDFKDEEKGFDFSKSFVVYGNTKLGNIYFTQYLAAICEKKFPNIKTACLHPGAVNTEFSRFVSNFSFLGKFFFYTFYPVYLFLFKTQYVGAQTSLSLCYMDFNKIENGKYYVDNAKADTYPIANETKIRDEFIKYSWMLLEKISKDVYNIPRFDL